MANDTAPRRFGVGFAGCGNITQASHLPAVASLPGSFRVVHCNDADASVAAAVATRTGAPRWSASLDELVGDPDVDVVVVGVPDRFHADVVVAACEASKLAVVCEKPLASTLEDADRIIEASSRSGVPVVVATMHRYDPVTRWVEQRYADLLASATVVRSTMYVPNNDRLVDLATQRARPAAAAATGAAKPPDPDALRAILPGAWASTTFVHHMPLLRLAFSAEPDSVSAWALGTDGAQVSLRFGDRLAQMSGLLYRFGGLDWSFDAWSASTRLRIEYPPSFLSTRSATAIVRTAAGGAFDETRFTGTFETGYRAEWRHVARVAAGAEAPLTPAAEARADIALAATIAAAGRQAIEDEGGTAR